MGIRFFCEHCNRKLNVKDFLGGKRGICPHCGGGIDIPTESKINRDGTPVTASEASEANQADAEKEPVAEKTADATRSVAIQTETPADEAPTVPAPTKAADPAPKGVSPAADPMAANPMTPAPEPAPVNQPTSDAIAEAPDAVWYVRPPSGGQYGPAAGDTMRKWLDQGRVGFDSLVWREGWPDWKQAGEVFPQITPSGVSPSSQSAPAMTADQREPTFAVDSATTIPTLDAADEDSADESPSSRLRRNGTQTNRGVAILVAFGAVGILLIGGFMWFMWATGASNKPQSGTSTWSAAHRSTSWPHSHAPFLQPTDQHRQVG